jgi:hypothetical protein
LPLHGFELTPQRETSTVALTLLLLLGLYAVTIWGLVWLLRRLRVSRRWAILLGFLGFGAVTGALTVWVWPFDSSIYFNFPATFVGDWVYNSSIQVFGDAHSPQAHWTIPWLLRIPQVYIAVAIALSGLAGGALQWADTWRTR